jgi:hypothetical protein
MYYFCSKFSLQQEIDSSDNFFIGGFTIFLEKTQAFKDLK